MRKNVPIYRLPANTNFNDPSHLENLNKILQNLGDRLDTVQQIGVTTAPPTPQSVAVQGLQGIFAITWARIANVDGYIIAWATDSQMLQMVGRQSLPDGETVQYHLPIGNCAQKYFFTVSSYRGNKVSHPSAAVNATSVAFTTSGNAPLAAPQAPRAPLTVGPRNGTTLP